MDDPSTRGTRRAIDGVNIAYQVRGDGPVDLVYVPGFTSNLEVELEEPRNAPGSAKLARSPDLILFDKRGTGLSDRTRIARPRDARRRSPGGARRRGLGAGGPCGRRQTEEPLAIVLRGDVPRACAALSSTERTRATHGLRLPIGQKEEDFLRSDGRWRRRWGTIEHAQDVDRCAESPVARPRREYVEWFAKALRHGASPAAALEFDGLCTRIDVRAILGSVQAPTLVLVRRLARLTEGAGEAATATSPIGSPASSTSSCPAATTASSWAHESELLLDEIEGFVRSGRAPKQAEIDRVLATVLFTDIVGSTEKAVELGDSAWKRPVAATSRGRPRDDRTLPGHGESTRQATGSSRRSTDPLAACAAPRRSWKRYGRSGSRSAPACHTGEVELDGDEVQGIAVHIGARVGALAQPSEVLVSQTVKDLVAGSGLTFDDAGEHELKGVPDRWRLYRVVS